MLDQPKFHQNTTEIQPNYNRDFTQQFRISLKFAHVMRRAFVIQLNDPSCPDTFEGRIEHVDSGRDGRFRSLEELLRFIKESLNEAGQAETDEGDLSELSMPLKN